jgi:branched-chain amino acid transport system ATP-binding protein
MLEINSLNFYFGELHILKDISMRVGNDEIVSVVGANGAGKSTLLKTLVGILPSTSGKIEFLGKEIQNLPSHQIVKMGLVQVPEERLLFSGMTVHENLLLGAYHRTDRKEREKGLESTYQLFPILRERKKQKAGSLSGGEQQMLALGRALMATPVLLMLDEPSLGLAPQVVEEVFVVVQKINESGVSILLVEQDIFVSLSIADRGYVLENGEMVLEGTGEELLESAHVKEAYMGM